MTLPRWAKVILILAAVAAFLALAAALAGWLYWRAHKDELKAAFKAQAEQLVAEGRAAMEEGRKFGTGADQNGCMDEAFRRLDALSGVLAEAGNSIFAASCLSAARPSPGFCSDVPPGDEIIASVTWALKACDARGRPNDQRCNRLMRAVQKHCGAKGPAGAGPAGGPAGG